MRLIGTLESEQEAYAFYSFLLKEGIQNTYEPCSEKSGRKTYRLWVYEEDDLENAMQWLQRFKENPRDSKFQAPPTPIVRPVQPAEISEKEESKWQPVQAVRVQRKRLSLTLTHLVIILCAFLFFWNSAQKEQIKNKGPIAEEIAMTPLMHALLIDVPSSYKYIEELLNQFPINTYKDVKDFPPEAQALIRQAEEAPSWHGLYSYLTTDRQVKLFEKVREGQLWRLFTPCLLHHDFLHILFNMIWVWILLKQIEERMQKWKICLLILIISVLSNVAQYLVSGPDFLGFSGVVVGLAGFIWVRQKVAPWEGYPLQKSTLLFLLFFVLAMFVLELFTFSLRAFSIGQFSAHIANTAHIVGGLVGMGLGRLAFFGRRVS